MPEDAPAPSPTSAQAPLIADPRAVHRSDFFPGLGWMLDRRRWTQELGPKWPTGFWDDWLREPPQRRGRAFLRPEVSRSYTFGESGVSQAQFFARYLATVRLNDVPVDWAAEDLSYLAKGAYDAALLAAVAGAARVDPGDVFGRSCEGGGGAGPPPVLSVLAAPYADEAAYVRLADVRRGRGGGRAWRRPHSLSPPPLPAVLWLPGRPQGGGPPHSVPRRSLRAPPRLPQAVRPRRDAAGQQGQRGR